VFVGRAHRGRRDAGSESPVEFLDVDRLRQVRGETRGLRAAHILLHPVSGQRNPRECPAPPELGHEIAAVAVGQSDIGDQQIEILAHRDRARLAHTAGGQHMMTPATQQSRQRLAGGPVILHE
jgi:hypothetical protein